MEAAVAIASVARVRPLQSIPFGQRDFALSEVPHDCPSEVDQKQLEELHLAIVKKAE
jgi:hypothetical protein